MTVTAMPPGSKTTPVEPAEKKKGRRKKVIMVLALLLVIAAGGWFFLKPDTVTAPVHGEVKTLDALQLNLAEGHYLRLGMALQLAEGGEDVDGAKALDTAIALFSGLEIADVARGEQREKLRSELLEQLDEKYEGDVLEVYFTEFVTQ